MPVVQGSLVPQKSNVIPVIDATAIDMPQQNRLNEIGDFGYGLCTCMDEKTCCKPIWWSAYCLPCITAGQLVNRFHWDACSNNTTRSRSEVFFFFVGIILLLALLAILFFTSIRCTSEDDYYGYYSGYNTTVCGVAKYGWFIYFLWLAVFITYIVMLVKMRIRFRKHYNIQGSCCEDCLTVYFCNCCSLIQMLRQTHDETKYPYTFCNWMTGLPENAPELV